MTFVLIALLVAGVFSACGEKAATKVKVQQLDSLDAQELASFELSVANYSYALASGEYRKASTSYGEILDEIDNAIEILRRSPDAEDADGVSVRERMADSAATLQAGDELAADLGRRIEIAINALPN